MFGRVPLFYTANISYRCRIVFFANETLSVVNFFDELCWFILKMGSVLTGLNESQEKGK